MRKCLFCTVFLLGLAGQWTKLKAQSLFIDGKFDDWQNYDPITVDPRGDGIEGIDLRQLFVVSTQDYLLIQLGVGSEINLQERNDIRIHMDIDNDRNTGRSIGGLGADLSYYPGERFGVFTDPKSNVSYLINHNDIGFVALPTVTSSEFEISIARRGIIEGVSYTIEGSISMFIEDFVQGGDRLPNSGSLLLDLTDRPNFKRPFSFGSADEHIRLVSYNVEFDGLFELGRRESQRRIIKALDADIYAFQEIYDASPSSVNTVLRQELGGTWYTSGVEPDIIIGSRYPIIWTQRISGNGAFVLNTGEDTILLINVHLPCCSNDLDRQSESDEIMAFIRDAQAGQYNALIHEDTPIIITGDFNLVGDSEQLTTLLTGDIENNTIFGPDFAPDQGVLPLVDAAPIVWETPLGYTYIRPQGTYSAGKLDYFLYTGSTITIQNSFVLDTQVPAAATLVTQNGMDIEDSRTSDHQPLVIDFKLPLAASTNQSSVSSRNIIYTPSTLNDLIANETVDRLSIWDMSGQILY